MYNHTPYIKDNQPLSPYKNFDIFENYQSQINVSLGQL